MSDNKLPITGFSSLAVHAGHTDDPNYAHLTPIYASSTYVFDEAAQGMRRFNGEEKGYIYGRWGSPSTTEAEEKIAAMESFGLTDASGNALQLKAILHASGMAALSTLMISNVKAGDKVLSHFSLYGGTHELLEKILLETDILELKANPGKAANGTVIEASLDKGRGYVATILVQNGTLRQGDMIVSGQNFGKVKAMYNERNQRVDIAPPSTPVLILGLNGAPQAGETFKVFTDEAEARETAYKRGQILREQGMRAKKHITLDEIGRRLALGNFKELNVIIKGDVDGSVEALSDSLQKLSTEEIVVRVIHKAVGAISESDVTLANASDAIIIGFNVRPSMQAARLAETEAIQIKLYSIIYNAIEEIKSAMEGMLEPTVEEKILGNVEVKETYRFDKATVAGCFVLDGKMARNNRIRLVRDGIVIFTGELGSLKRYKDDAKEVTSSMECGLTIKNYNDLKVGDIVEAFEEVEVKRTL